MLSSIDPCVRITFKQIYNDDNKSLITPQGDTLLDELFSSNQPLSQALSKLNDPKEREKMINTKLKEMHESFTTHPDEYSPADWLSLNHNIHPTCSSCSCKKFFDARRYDRQQWEQEQAEYTNKHLADKSSDVEVQQGK